MCRESNVLQYVRPPGLLPYHRRQLEPLVGLSELQDLTSERSDCANCWCTDVEQATHGQVMNLHLSHCAQLVEIFRALLGKHLQYQS